MVGRGLVSRETEHPAKREGWSLKRGQSSKGGDPSPRNRKAQGRGGGRGAERGQEGRRGIWHRLRLPGLNLLVRSLLIAG